MRTLRGALHFRHIARPSSLVPMSPTRPFEVVASTLLPRSLPSSRPLTVRTTPTEPRSDYKRVESESYHPLLCLSLTYLDRAPTISNDSLHCFFPLAIIARSSKTWRVSARLCSSSTVSRTTTSPLLRSFSTCVILFDGYYQYSGCS